MLIHEFQTKQLLEKYGIPVPEFAVISHPEALRTLVFEKQWPAIVLKAQIHAGARGKAGGVKFVGTLDEMVGSAQALLGKRLVTAQTGKEGLPVHQLLVSPPVAIRCEYYVGFTVDRESACTLLMASPAGGVEIERIAHDHPDRLLVLKLPPEGSLRSYHEIRLTKFMGWEKAIALQGIRIVEALAKAFREMDLTLLEINPLVETEEGQLTALDAKLVADDNALYRQPALRAAFDPSQLHPQEALAQQQGLAYVSMEGNIGCMVNGAGLAMATMDLLHYHGGQAANFLDVGGGASQDKVAEGFKIILSDPRVKVVLLMIFGGIMDCEKLAAGILSAVKHLQVKVPLVVRLEGTHAEQGRRLLLESDLTIVSVDDLAEAAEQAVRIADRRLA